MFRAPGLILLLLIELGSPLSAQSPLNTTCPHIEISTPHAKNTSAGHIHHISPTFEGAADLDLESLKYKWTLPDGFPFEGQGRPDISFVVIEAMNGQDVEVFLDVEGLPPSCARTASAKFSILINPGSPLVLDVYENLPINEERTRLAAAVDQLKRWGDTKALIVINYKVTDSEKSIKKRAARIVSLLSGIHKLPLDSFSFVFAETGFRSTRIYAWKQEWPTGVYSAASYQRFRVRR